MPFFLANLNVICNLSRSSLNQITCNLQLSMSILESSLIVIIFLYTVYTLNATVHGSISSSLPSLLIFLQLQWRVKMQMRSKSQKRDWKSRKTRQMSLSLKQMGKTRDQSQRLTRTKMSLKVVRVHSAMINWRLNLKTLWQGLILNEERFVLEPAFTYFSLHHNTYTDSLFRMDYGRGFRLIFQMKNSSQYWEWRKMLFTSCPSGSRTWTKRKSISSRNRFAKYQSIKCFSCCASELLVCLYTYHPSAT